MSLTCRKLDSDGDITHVMLTGDDAIRQTVICEIKFILGEWFLDISKGIPWIAQPNATARPILGVLPADLFYGEALIKAKILSCPGVASIAAFSFVLNHNTRAATVEAQVTTITGGSFTISETLP